MIYNHARNVIIVAPTMRGLKMASFSCYTSLAYPVPLPNRYATEGSGVRLYIELFQWNVINASDRNARNISLWAAGAATVASSGCRAVYVVERICHKERRKREGEFY